MEEKINELNFDEREALIIIANALYKKTGDEFYKNVVANAEELNNREVVSKTENTTFPKEGVRYWFIFDGTRIDWGVWDGCQDDIEKMTIGNVFRTEAEAELAIKKLQAFKRLRDKGFKFRDWNWGEILFEFDWEKQSGMEKDLDLLFSGEEE